MGSWRREDGNQASLERGRWVWRLIGRGGGLETRLALTNCKYTYNSTQDYVLCTFLVYFILLSNKCFHIPSRELTNQWIQNCINMVFYF